jgi:hypothetical protein
MAFNFSLRSSLLESSTLARNDGILIVCIISAALKNNNNNNKLYENLHFIMRVETSVDSYSL